MFCHWKAESEEAINEQLGPRLLVVAISSFCNQKPNYIMNDFLESIIKRDPAAKSKLSLLVTISVTIVLPPQ